MVNLLGFFGHVVYSLPSVMKSLIFAILLVDCWLCAVIADDISLSILDKPVSVHRDAYGIPHVFAANRLDGARVIGWLHASDRLWQMDLLRRQASDTMSEAVSYTHLTLPTILLV